MNIIPTKGNLIAQKKSLFLAQHGYDLLDKKRLIMMREMMSLMGEAERVQGEIDAAFARAYAALVEAYMTLGKNAVVQIADSIKTDDSLTLLYRSVMGAELPVLSLGGGIERIPYGYGLTNNHLDEAYIEFNRVKSLAVRAAAVENSVWRLAYSIKQTKKRANALKNIIIPQLEESVAYISGYLEEKERDAFTTLKVIKRNSKK